MLTLWNLFAFHWITEHCQDPKYHHLHHFNCSHFWGEISNFSTVHFNWKSKFFYEKANKSSPTSHHLVIFFLIIKFTDLHLMLTSTCIDTRTTTSTFWFIGEINNWFTRYKFALGKTSMLKYFELHLKSLSSHSHNKTIKIKIFAFSLKCHIKRVT